MEKFNTCFSIAITPVLHGDIAPIIRYGMGTAKTLVVQEQTILEYNQDLCPGNYTFDIELLNKTDETPDLALIIESVTVFGITLDRFKWSNKYYPRYPKIWASEQTTALPEFYQSATCLGWNGCWKFEFSAPIFRWIHQVENLGWLYD